MVIKILLFFIIKIKNIYFWKLDLFETGRFLKLFENTEVIGSGGFGKVFKAVHKIDK